MASKAWLLVKENIDNGNIKEWVRTMTEEQIALSCGVSYSSFQKFKKQHKELEEEIIKGKKTLCSDLKSALIKKALGYDYDEVTIFQDGTQKIVKKHVQADTGAIHLLLKNNDDNWHNDDCITIKQKEKLNELKERELELKENLNKEDGHEFVGTEYLKDAFEQIIGNESDNNG